MLEFVVLPVVHGLSVSMGKMAISEKNDIIDRWNACLYCMKASKKVTAEQGA